MPDNTTGRRDPAIEAAQRTSAAYCRGEVPAEPECTNHEPGVNEIAEFAACEALKPIQAALADGYAKLLEVLAGPGATLRSEAVCMETLAKIGLLAGWEPER